MAEIRKVPTGFAVTTDEKKEIDKRVKPRFTSRSELVAHAVHRVVTDSSVLSRLVLTLVAGPERDESRKANNTVMVEINDLDELDKIANRLGTSRNTLMNMIAGGIITGVFD